MPRVHAGYLRAACDVRGISRGELFEAANFSRPTRASLNRGREVSAGTIKRLDAALAQFEVLERIAGLVVVDPMPTPNE